MILVGVGEGVGEGGGVGEGVGVGVGSDRVVTVMTLELSLMMEPL